VSALKIQIAESDTFLKALIDLPKDVQLKTAAFISKFRENPVSPGLNYEVVKGARDETMKSVRVDQNHRCIVSKPKAGGVYFLLWVGPHDDAYRWARRRKLAVHPETGGIQIISMEEVVESPVSSPAPKGLFSAFSEKQLLRLGVPRELFQGVNRINSVDELLATELPAEAAEALVDLACGERFEDVLAKRKKYLADKKPDPADFAAALQNPDSKRRFFIIEDDEAMMAVLNAPLETWRIFLHPHQRKVVEAPERGIRLILGGAGTGKTVVAMHRAKWLAGRLPPGEPGKVLFTTFSTNLAADVRANLAKICFPSELSRIEVVNIDKWVAENLRKRKFDYRVGYGKELRALWQKAVDSVDLPACLDATCCREEWEKIIQPHGVDTFQDYSKILREGRSISLDRGIRRAVWRVVEEYRSLLNDAGLREAEDAMRDLRSILETAGEKGLYAHVVVDEAQDLGAQAFRLLRLVAHDPLDNVNLTMVGDPYQRIYRDRVDLLKCGIDAKGSVDYLRINYRTTEETRAWASDMMKAEPADDMMGGVQSTKDYRSLLRGPIPNVCASADFAADADSVAKGISELIASGVDARSICLVARTEEMLHQYQTQLSAKGLVSVLLKQGEADASGDAGIRLATMHRVKGLEFDYIWVVAVNDGLLPLATEALETKDVAAKASLFARERSLLYVAATRAKKHVCVTWFGRQSPFLLLPKGSTKSSE
jgi:superfamily I DNA/RNA helicase